MSVKVLEILQQRRSELAAIESPKANWSKITEWHARTRPVIAQYFPQQLDPFDSLISPRWAAYPRAYSGGRNLMPGADSAERAANEKIAAGAQDKLLAHVDALIELIGIEGAATGPEPTPDGAPGRISALRLICGRFHSVAAQLRSRHDHRATLDVGDEYDVQDLMHALLRLFFEDIRPEEWTPSYAGHSNRMDFLLKPDRIVIETKKTRKGVAAKEIGQQLILDIEHYKKHPDCEHLVCFVYDPDNLIANPRGLESDLAREEDGFAVTVFVVPT